MSEAALAVTAAAAAVHAAVAVSPLIRMEGISKRYGGVRALENAHVEVAPGRIHAILGENGAGKSTLIKIIAGVVAPDEGRMLIGDREVTFRSPAEAAAEGIACVFQELSLVPDLTVAENLDMPLSYRNFKKSEREAMVADTLDKFGKTMTPDQVKELKALGEALWENLVRLGC